MKNYLIAIVAPNVCIKPKGVDVRTPYSIPIPVFLPTLKSIEKPAVRPVKADDLF
jgi:hypothetical protein